MKDTYKYRRWTFEEDELLKKLYQKKTLNELAIIFDRHWNKICRRAILLDIKKDRKIFAKLVSEGQKKTFREGRTHKGELNPNWKGGVKRSFGGVSCGLYNTIHPWLRNNYGKATRCENKDCKNISTNYQWSKLSNKKYEKKRENFWQLCVSCHKKYDLNYERHISSS